MFQILPSWLTLHYSTFFRKQILQNPETTSKQNIYELLIYLDFLM